MKTKTKVLPLALLILIFTIISNVSAFTYYHPGYSYSYPKTTVAFPTFEEKQRIFPKYQNLPDISETISIKNKDSVAYTISYQGGFTERKTIIDEFFKKGRKGREVNQRTKTITEKIIGPTYYESFGSQSSNSNTQKFILNPNNPTYYDGGSSFNVKDTYDFKSFGADKYGSSYYYQPIYSGGRYNWRY